MLAAPVTQNHWRGFVQRHGSIFLMLALQAYSTILSITGRVLRIGYGTDGRGVIGTSEILMFMMAITAILSWAYIYYLRTPGFHFADKEGLALLFLYRIAGFFCIRGFYYSLQDLALAEGTIINFIAPILAMLLAGTI
ncbi:hypothetical protein K504DRAFT_420035 [Pleomassaria siparia CBS 279.74]|uniref:EamA domain-containing protein n=1 Tax=Pleomassaria siparia CBS 279.74 TaxID=1314801 RepID=A0A6G1KN30_9PLEO|nr:hypothetical protein K504DRAFT_420035 [Pleomassaria siparia CBS 279.74]